MQNTVMVANVMMVSEAQIAPGSNAHLPTMLLVVMEIPKDVIALVVVNVITALVFANVSLGTMVTLARLKPR